RWTQSDHHAAADHRPVERARNGQLRRSLVVGYRHRYLGRVTLVAGCVEGCSLQRVGTVWDFRRIPAKGVWGYGVGGIRHPVYPENNLCYPYIISRTHADRD